MTLRLDKLISVIVFIVIAILGATSLNPFAGRLAGVGLAAMISLPGLALIWFAEPLGEQTCFARGMVRPSPPLLIEAFGWLFLLGYPALLLIVSM